MLEEQLQVSHLATRCVSRLKVLRQCRLQSGDRAGSKEQPNTFSILLEAASGLAVIGLAGGNT